MARTKPDSPREIYVKNADDDADFREGVIEISNRLQIYLQQIRNALSPSRGTVMGAADMAADLEEQLFQSNLSATGLENKILRLIHTYCTYSTEFSTDVNVKFARGTRRDVVFIDIVVEGIKRLEVRLR